jgi:hypothetical protein
MKKIIPFALLVFISLACSKNMSLTSPSQNPTSTPTAPVNQIVTNTATIIQSATTIPTSTPTNTYTPVISWIPTSQVTSTHTVANTFTPTNTNTAAVSISQTPNVTASTTAYITYQPTQTFTHTLTPTNTPLGWIAPTATPTYYIPSTGILLRGELGLNAPACGQIIASMAVNGQAESTAILILSMPTGSVTLPMDHTNDYLGQTYGYYYQSGVGATQPGSSYTLTAITSIGTASVTVNCPGPMTVSSDGMTIGWQRNGTHIDYSINPTTGSTTAWGSGDGTAPIILPASAFPRPGTYQYSAQLWTSAPVDGATGYYSQFKVGVALCTSIVH